MQPPTSACWSGAKGPSARRRRRQSSRHLGYSPPPRARRRRAAGPACARRGDRRGSVAAAAEHPTEGAKAGGGQTGQLEIYKGTALLSTPKIRKSASHLTPPHVTLTLHLTSPHFTPPHLKRAEQALLVRLTRRVGVRQVTADQHHVPPRQLPLTWRASGGGTSGTSRLRCPCGRPGSPASNGDPQ